MQAKRVKLLCVLVSVLMVFIGCATYQPIIDRQSIGDPAQYQKDLAE